MAFSRFDDILQYKVPLTNYVRSAVSDYKVRPLNHMTVSQWLKRQKVDYTPHDLRRTFASRLADLGVMPHVIEKLLNHKIVGVMATYNRSEYWEERVAAMELWCAKIEELKKWPRELSSTSA